MRLGLEPARVHGEQHQREDERADHRAPAGARCGRPSGRRGGRPGRRRRRRRPSGGLHRQALDARAPRRPRRPRASGPSSRGTRRRARAGGAGGSRSRSPRRRRRGRSPPGRPGPRSRTATPFVQRNGLAEAREDGAEPLLVGPVVPGPPRRSAARPRPSAPSGVPSATMWPWSMIPTRSASTSASSRYCVVRKTVTPSSRASRATSSQSAVRLCDVEPGRRLVEEEDPRPVDERERQVEPALHPARVAAHLAVGGLGRGRRGEELVRARAALRARERLERRLQAQVLAAGQERVERGLLQRGADPLPHLRAPGGRRRSRRREPSRRSAAAASSACAPSSTCPPRSGRGSRRSRPRRPRGRSRRRRARRP